MKKTILAVAMASMLVLSACGSDEQEAADAISESLMKQQKDGATILSLEQKEADCIGEGMVDGVGVDQLQEYDILTEENTVDKQPGEVKMSEADARATTDALFECTDVTAMLNQQMAGQMAAQDPAVKKCVDEVLTEERLRNLFVSLFQGKQAEAQQDLVEPMTKCATEAMGG